MARQIIVLENSNPGRTPLQPIGYSFAMWLSVPAARQTYYANASATSAVKNATGPELTAIQNGSIHEVLDTFTVPPGTSLATIEAGIVVEFAARQASINSSAENAWDHYGTYYDGTTWTMVTVT